MMTLAQQTYVPDDNFEQALINLGYDNILDDSVVTANINTVLGLSVSHGALNGIGINDLTGIEDFTALTYLDCQYNNLTSLDVSNNTVLTGLVCHYNQLTSLDLSQNPLIDNLLVEHNQLTSIDVSHIIGLIDFSCNNNKLVSLNLTNNIMLAKLNCDSNLLTSIDLRNDSNTSLNVFSTTTNPLLTCINVDDAIWSTANWVGSWFQFDSQHYFSNNCPPPSAIEEHTTNKELLRTIDVLGRETTNNPLFYIYDDGTVEKRIVIE